MLLVSPQLGLKVSGQTFGRALLDIWQDDGRDIHPSLRVKQFPSWMSSEKVAECGTSTGNIAAQPSKPRQPG